MSSPLRIAVLSVLSVLAAGVAVLGPGSAVQAAVMRPSSAIATAEHRQARVAVTPTATTLVVSAPRIAFGQPVELTATVSSTGPTINGGTVAFRAGSTVLGSAPVANGTAALSVPTLAVGRYQLTAAFSGTDDLLPSMSGVNGTSPIRTIAGTGTPGFSGDGGAATSARFNYPSNLAVDGTGNVYVVDNGNNRIRKVATDGTITTVAGIGVGGFSGDGGPATSARLSNPYSIAVDAAGTIFIGDDGNNRIRKVDLQGTITTYAGTGISGFSGDGGPATLANLRVASMAIDAAGTVYFTDQGNGYVRKITPDGIISTIAGNGTSGYSGDGGPGTSAQIRSPYGVGVDVAGNVYFAEISNHVIRMVTPQGIISTYAGTGVAGSTGNGGQATLARLSTPGGMAVDASGSVFFNQFGTNQVRKVAPDGIISTVAGTGTAGYSGDGGPSTSAQLNDTEGLGIDAAGNLYLADSSNNVVRRVDGPVALVVTAKATADSYATSEDTPLVSAAPGVLANDINADDNPLGAVLVSGPTHGTLTLDADGSFTYTPDADFNGADSFTYRATDGNVTSAPITVTLTVSPANDAPASIPDAYTTREGTALVVAAPGPLGNDADVDGDALSAVLVDGPVHGTLSLGSNGAFTYTPSADYSGGDSFTYRASDGTLTSAVTTVSLVVTANGVPVADAGPDQDVDGGDTVMLDATGSTEPDGDTVTYSWAQVGGATVALPGATSARPTFTAPTGPATLTFRLTIDDGEGGTDTDTVVVTVNGVPVADAGPDQDVAASGAVTLDATGSADPDRDPLTYAWVQTAGPAQTLAGATTPRPTFTAPASSAVLTFVVTIDDGRDGTDTDTVTITVDADAPGVTLSTTNDEPVDGPFPVTITFTEPVTGLDLGEVGVTNGVASALDGSGTTYTVLVTPTADGDVTVTLPAGSAVDTVGNVSDAAAPLVLLVDGTAPTLVLTRAPGQPDPVRADEAAFVARASEPVSDLAAADVEVLGTSGASTVAVTRVDATSFSVVVRGMDRTGSVQVRTAADAVTDAAGNGTPAVTSPAVRWASTRLPLLRLSADQRCLAPGASVGLRLTVDDGATLTVTSSNTALLPTSRITLRRDGRALRLVLIPEKLASGRARVTVAATNQAGTRRIAINVLVGTNDANRLVGTPGADVLLARHSGDRLYGRAGRDLLCGRRGNDLLVGGPGRDTLYGQRGDDVLVGSRQDRLVGGPGRDRLVRR